MKLKQFIISHYRHPRLYGRGKVYGDSLIENAEKELNQYGYGIISRHESTSGEPIFYKEKEGGNIKIITRKEEIHQLLEGEKN